MDLEGSCDTEPLFFRTAPFDQTEDRTPRIDHVDQPDPAHVLPSG